MDIALSKESLIDLVFQIIEYTNSERSIDQKLTDSLAHLCASLPYKRAFVYQTDGFRFFHLHESIGNEDGLLRSKFEWAELSPSHAQRIESDEHRVYAMESQQPTATELDILQFHNVHSLLARPVKDSDGKVVGFVGLADSETENLFSTEQLYMLHIILDQIGKEVATREYQAREVRSRNTLESIMNNMGVDIYVNDFHTHEALYANRSMAEPYGGIQNFLGKKCWEVLYKDRTDECPYCPKARLIDENGNPTRVYSWDYQRPFDGTWFRVFSAAFNWIDGQLAHVITSVDITHQKAVEAELVVAKEKAENLDRLKSAFLANMSHEIRTPLNAIVGFSDLLTETADQQDREDYMKVIHQNNELLLQLITDIIDLSKIESNTLDYEIKRFNARELSEEVTRIYQVKNTNGITVRSEQNTQEYHLQSDKKRLTQVVINLINNALKFTQEGEIVLGYQSKANNWIEFYVQDTGIGIPADKVDHVFDRFVKLDSFAQGTGLGLSICKSIVEHLGGSIGVDSKPGVGSRFWFTLPLTPEKQ